jgi:lambda family phage portal protein
MSSQWTTTIGYTGRNHPLNRYRLTRMRDRARDLERNNVLATAMLDRAVENVIYTGILPCPGTPDKDFNKEVRRKFVAWFDEAEIRGLMDMSDLQQIVFRSMLRDGDVGVAMVEGAGDLALQVIEGDLIDTPYGQLNNPRMVDGIEFDDYGRPLVYHCLTVTPTTGKRLESKIDAKDFCWLPRMKRATAVRGEPAYAPVFDKFDQIDGLADAVVVAGRVAACQALLIKKAGAATGFNALGTQTSSTNTSQKLQSMEPGMVHYLNPGEEVVTVNPTQPQQQFGDFLANFVRLIGICVGLPLEILLLDFSRTNYSSARAALLQLQRAARPHQKRFIHRILRPIYVRRIQRWIDEGELKVPAGIPDPLKHSWIPPGWAWVDPQKDIAAALMAIDGNLDSRENIIASHGRELEDVLDQRQREEEEIAERELPSVRSINTRDPLALPQLDANGKPIAPAKPGAPTDNGKEEDAEDDPVETDPNEE